MLVNRIYEIPSCDDVELGIKRESMLEFKLCYDDEKPVKAVVFIVPGLGGDANDSYREHLAQFVADEFNVAVASVNYHCIGNRPQNGATYFLDDLDKIILKKKYSDIDIEIPSKIDIETLPALDAKISRKKANGDLPNDFKLQIPITLQPTKNEYQNFGVMQAQDVINAALFIKANPPFNSITDINELPVILIGSSHGAYINALAAKFAPWLIDGIIDNSSYAKLNWELIGLGKEIDYVKFSEYFTDIYFKNIRIYAFTKTMWTLLNKSSSSYFSQAREDIRNPLNAEHLKIQSLYPKPIYVGYHCAVKDHCAPPEEKAQLYEELRKLGFDATLYMIKDESQLDGKFIKTLTHGLDMSIKTLISKELPPMLSKIAICEKQICKNKTVSYVADDLEYKFFEENGKINLEIKKRN
jgi:carbonic anyhydrase